MPTPATSVTSLPSSRNASSARPKPSASAQHPLEPAGLGGRGVSPDPSVWSAEQQQQFMRALMGAAAAGPTGQTPIQSPLGDPSDPIDPSLPPLDNPLAALLFPQGLPSNGASPSSNPLALGPAAGTSGVFGQQQEVKTEKPPSPLQKYVPLIHYVVLWCLLAYFVLVLEPKMYAGEVIDAFPSIGIWGRWRNLAKQLPGLDTVPKAYSVQIVVSSLFFTCLDLLTSLVHQPFFWAFMTFEVVLHSIQIFTGAVCLFCVRHKSLLNQFLQNSVQPPSLLAMVLPQLPPPIPSVVINSLKYIRMGSMFLDDVAGIIVGLGFIVYFSGLFATSSGW